MLPLTAAPYAGEGGTMRINVKYHPVTVGHSFDVLINGKVWMVEWADELTPEKVASLLESVAFQVSQKCAK